VVFQCNRRDGCNKELRPRVLIHEFLDRIVSRRAQALAEIDSPLSLSTNLRACSMLECASGGLRQMTAPRPEPMPNCGTDRSAH
jgi:hypothetical protein